MREGTDPCAAAAGPRWAATFADRKGVAAAAALLRSEAALWREGTALRILAAMIVPTIHLGLLLELLMFSFGSALFSAER